MKSLFLIAALALPSAMETGWIPHMDAPVWARIQMVRMLQAFTSEYVEHNERRVLVMGGLWRMVDVMRRNRIKAYGLHVGRPGSRFIVQGVDLFIPFARESFSIVINDHAMDRIMDLMVLRVKEMARVLVPGGFLLTPSEPSDRVDHYLQQIHFERLPWTFQNLAIFQKKGAHRIYWGARSA